MSEDRGGLDGKRFDATGAISRRRLQGGALGAFAALAAARGAMAWPGVPAPSPEAQPDANALFLALGSVAPHRFAAGEVRFARTESLPALQGLALAAITMQPRAVRELHWHNNADELTHIRSGSGVAIIFYDGTSAVVPLQPGTLVFFPQGAAHAIWNASDEPMEMILGFDTASPETINFSASLPFVPSQVIAQAGGVEPGAAPFLPTAGIGFAVPLAGEPPAPTGNASEFSTMMAAVDLETFPGGSRRLTSEKNIPRMSGIKTTILTLKPGGTRLPHWHPHMNELAYCLDGRVQMGIIGQDDLEQTAVLSPGDLGFVPLNWFHYLTNVGETEATIVLYHNAIPQGVIDLKDVLAWFPPELLAASFGLDGEAFAGLAGGNAPIIAARNGAD